MMRTITDASKLNLFGFEERVGALLKSFWTPEQYSHPFVRKQVSAGLDH